MKIIGICSGHDCSYAILENGIPIIHNELERFIRQKEPIDDAVKFLFDTYFIQALFVQTSLSIH